MGGTTLNLSILYTTYPNETEAKKIIEVLLKESLIVCANIIPKITSMYEWKGKTQVDQESVAVLKTTSGLLNRVEKRIKELHSYDIPCILQLPQVQANHEFTTWVESILN